MRTFKHLHILLIWLLCVSLLCVSLLGIGILCVGLLAVGLIGIGLLAIGLIGVHLLAIHLIGIAALAATQSLPHNLAQDDKDEAVQQEAGWGWAARVAGDPAASQTGDGLEQERAGDQSFLTIDIYNSSRKF